MWKKADVRFFTIPSFVHAGGVVCAFSTRIGGVSPTPYDTLNFSRKREKNEEHFQENMRRFAVAAGFDYQNAVSDNYAHGSQVYRAEQKDAGFGIVKENLPDYCDGLFTDTEQLPIVSFHADCVPLFFMILCGAQWRFVTPAGGVRHSTLRKTRFSLCGRLDANRKIFWLQ